MDETQNQEEVKTEETTEQSEQGLMSKATLEQEETTQDEGMATKPGDQVVEGEDLDNVQFEKPEHWQDKFWDDKEGPDPVSYTHLRAHET